MKNLSNNLMIEVKSFTIGIAIILLHIIPTIIASLFLIFFFNV